MLVMRLDGFARYAWWLLGYTILVILWGAFVRATGSGAGCGSHWPTCNGEVIPRSPQMETIIEFTHRASSGLLGFLLIGLLVWAWRRFSRGHPVRKGALAVLVLVVLEALVGAGIVKFEWVAGNASFARVIVMAFHLVNTFILLAFCALTAWWASGGGVPRFFSGGRKAALLVVSLAALALLGAGGAVTALGDTLVFQAGVTPEESPLVAALVAGRVYHPLMAVLAGGLLLGTVLSIKQADLSPPGSAIGRWLITLFCIQLGIGAANVVLQAPVWLQLTHLLFADLIWILLVLFAATALGESSQPDLPVESASRGGS